MYFMDKSSDVCLTSVSAPSHVIMYLFTQVKCHAYWPALQKEQTFGRITVKNLNEYTLPHYILRELLVQKAPKEDERVRVVCVCVCVCVCPCVRACVYGM